LHLGAGLFLDLLEMQAVILFQRRDALLGFLDPAPFVLEAFPPRPDDLQERFPG